MTLEILYFAWVRERLGRDGEIVDPPVEVTTVATLVDWLAARGTEEGGAFSDRARLRYAVDGRFAAGDTSIAGAREVAIFPPVTGG